MAGSRSSPRFTGTNNITACNTAEAGVYLRFCVQAGESFLVHGGVWAYVLHVTTLVCWALFEAGYPAGVQKSR